VVEFDDVNRVRRKGIIFLDDDGDLIVTHASNWHQPKNCRNFVKLGHTSCIPDGTGSWEGQPIAKAYFAATPASAPVGFKVGDRVKVVKKVVGKCPNWIPQMEECIGETYIIARINASGSIQLKGNMHNWHLDSLAPAPLTYTADPDKSYEENQAAWVKFHGLEVGSKVKVVRKFEDDEDGCKCRAWNAWDWKAEQQGEILVIYSVRSDCIWFDSGRYPYFALEPA
jgi:hypothetical protein